MEAEKTTEKSKNLAVAVDVETFARITFLAERLGESKRRIVRRAVGAMHVIEAAPRQENRPMSCCAHGTDGQHDE